MNASTIVAIAVILVMHFLASQLFLKKKLDIKPDTVSIFHQDRKKLFIAIDIGLLLLFTVGMMILHVENDISNFPGIVAIIPLFALFFLLSVNHAVEQWLLHRPKKAYWHEILSAAVMLMVFAVVWAGGR